MRSARLRLTDIIEEAQFISAARRARKIEAILSDPVLRRAVERALFIISEAARHLPEDLTADHAQVPWRDVRRVGDVLRHGYERIDPDVIADILMLEIDVLRHACETILAGLPPDD